MSISATISVRCSNWAVGQYDNDAFHGIVDLHALTVVDEPRIIGEQTVELAAMLFAVGSRLDVQFRVERVELEEVAVRAVAGRRHRAPVAQIFAVGPRVLSLQGRKRLAEFCVLGNSFGQAGGSRRDFVDHPMDPGLGHGGIRVVANQGQLPGSFRHGGPRQRWRDVYTLPRVFLGDRLFFGKCVTRNLDGHPLDSFLQ